MAEHTKYTLHSVNFSELQRVAFYWTVNITCHERWYRIISKKAAAVWIECSNEDQNSQSWHSSSGFGPHIRVNFPSSLWSIENSTTQSAIFPFDSCNIITFLLSRKNHSTINILQSIHNGFFFIVFMKTESMIQNECTSKRWMHEDWNFTIKRSENLYRLHTYVYIVTILPNVFWTRINHEKVNFRTLTKYAVHSIRIVCTFAIQFCFSGSKNFKTSWMPTLSTIHAVEKLQQR